MDNYKETERRLDELKTFSQEVGLPVITATQVTNPCAEIVLPKSYGIGIHPSFDYQRRIKKALDIPETEDEMLAVLNVKNGIIVVNKDYISPNEYLKSVKWFYEKYKLLFEEDEDELFTHFNRRSAQIIVDAIGKIVGVNV